MSFGEKTLIAIGAFLTTVFWIFVAIYVAGLWLACFPNDPDPEYACPTRTQQLFRSVIAFSIATVFTALFWRGMRKARDIRKDF